MHTSNSPAQINGLNIKHVTGGQSEENEKDLRLVRAMEETQRVMGEETNYEQKYRARYQAPCRGVIIG